jgi:hypothetical protein
MNLTKASNHYQSYTYRYPIPGVKTRVETRNRFPVIQYRLADSKDPGMPRSRGTSPELQPISPR